ncbi:MAG TPA: hypothetical protein VFW98_09090 [Gemmatimonadaceae bacterium]|nr:hypothetical protein [Gemmatimonadaceae bacterium]
MRAFFIPAFCGGIVLALARPAAAQVQQETYRHRCESGAAIVVHLNPDPTGARVARNHQTCLQEAAALVVDMQAHAHDTDLATLKAFWREADQWRDATIMAAALQLASDPSASSQARVFAVRHLLTLLHPHALYSYARLIRPDSSYWVPDTIPPLPHNDSTLYVLDSASRLTPSDSIYPSGPDSTKMTVFFACEGGGGSEGAGTFGTPLPANYVARIEQTLTSLAASSAAPWPVRRAAQCWKGGFRSPP